MLVLLITWADLLYIPKSKGDSISKLIDRFAPSLPQVLDGYEGIGKLFSEIY